MRKILSIVGIIIALILALFLFRWVLSISSNDTETTAVLTEEAAPINAESDIPVRGIKRIQEMAQETDQEIVEFGDIVYLGGPWGLIVGSKKDENFQQYLAQERVRNVSTKGGSLHYEELNSAEGNWVHKTVNLQAYEDFLNQQ